MDLMTVDLKPFNTDYNVEVNKDFFHEYYDTEKLDFCILSENEELFKNFDNKLIDTFNKGLRKMYSDDYTRYIIIPIDLVKLLFELYGTQCLPINLTIFMNHFRLKYKMVINKNDLKTIVNEIKIVESSIKSKNPMLQYLRNFNENDSADDYLFTSFTLLPNIADYRKCDLSLFKRFPASSMMKYIKNYYSEKSNNKLKEHIINFNTYSINKITCEIRSTIEKEYTEEVKKRIESEIREEFTDDIREEIGEQIEDEIRDEILEKATYENRKRVEDELKDQVFKEFNFNKVKKEIAHDMKERICNEFKQSFLNALYVLIYFTFIGTLYLSIEDKVHILIFIFMWLTGLYFGISVAYCLNLSFELGTILGVCTTVAMIFYECIQNDNCSDIYTSLNAHRFNFMFLINNTTSSNTTEYIN